MYDLPMTPVIGKNAFLYIGSTRNVFMVKNKLFEEF